MTKYKVIIYWNEEDQTYIAEVPELAGCIAVGSSYQEAVSNAERESVRPDLFKNPILSEYLDINFLRKQLPIREPLAGDDIYLQERLLNNMRWQSRIFGTSS